MSGVVIVRQPDDDGGAAGLVVGEPTATRSTVASSNGRPDSRMLSGRPRPENPARTASDGSPVRL